MGILLCEQNFRDVWRRNKSVRAEIGKILRTHTRGSISSKDYHRSCMASSWILLSKFVSVSPRYMAFKMHNSNNI